MMKKSNVEKNLNLIRKMAWSFHNTTGKDYEELEGEAIMAYIEAERKFYENPNIALNSFAYGVIRNRLIDVCSKKNEIIYEHQFTNDISFPEPSEEPQSFMEFLDELPHHCRPLAELIVDNKERFIGYQGKEAKKELREFLREQGWAWSEIWDSIREMKVALNKL